MSERRRSLWIAALASAAVGCPEACQRPEPDPEVSDRVASDPFVALSSEGMRQSLWPREGTAAYRPPDSDRRDATSTLIRSLAEQSQLSPNRAQLDALAAEAGFELHGWTVRGRRYLAVLEPPEKGTGAGAFVFRVGRPTQARREVILQAPHSFFDLGTGKIALRSFVAAGEDVRALFVNTLHRYVDETGGRAKREHNPADVCKNRDHLFAIATEAVARAFADIEVIQIHGYAAERRIEGMPGAAAVVSAGDPEGSSPRSTDVAERLRSRFRVEVARFPEDTKSLGATKNVQDACLEAHPSASFVHIELSKRFRELLRDDAKLRGFVDAVLSTGDDGPEPPEGPEPP